MIELIISGGQTGADQGGLRAGRAGGYETGGWAPKGWRTDEGPAPWLADYGLQESPFLGYRIRTLSNVRLAHALVWIGNRRSPGGVLTLAAADRKGIPQLIIPFPDTITYSPDDAIRKFLFACTSSTILMVAGNRERTNPGIGTYTEHVVGEGLIPF